MAMVQRLIEPIDSATNDQLLANNYYDVLPVNSKEEEDTIVNDDDETDKEDKEDDDGGCEEISYDEIIILLIALIATLLASLGVACYAAYGKHRMNNQVEPDPEESKPIRATDLSSDMINKM